jgi:hypothetical protein
MEWMAGDLHDFHFIDAVAEGLELVDSSACLFEWVVACSYGSHRRWLDERQWCPL